MTWKGKTQYFWHRDENKKYSSKDNFNFLVYRDNPHQRINIDKVTYTERDIDKDIYIYIYGDIYMEIYIHRRLHRNIEIYITVKLTVKPVRIYILLIT